MSSLIQDARLALRYFLKNPVFSAVILLSLALGIGANSTIFTLINAVFLNPLPVEDVPRLISVYTTDEGSRGFDPFGGNLPVSFRNYEDYRDGNASFGGLAAYTFAGISLAEGGEPELLAGQLVTGNYFEVLGLVPAAGRFFAPSEDQVPGRDPVVVLSYGLWQRRFGGSQSMIGRPLKLNSQLFTVIGVAPAGFHGTLVLGGADLWAPSMMHAQVLTGPIRQYFEDRRALLFSVFGRLKEGVDSEQARLEFIGIAEGLREQFPVANAGRGVKLEPLSLSTIPNNFRGMMVQAGTVLMTVVALVLLIACANVANLLASRSDSRRREIALRLATGAPRRRLVRQLLTESVLLSLGGGAAGLAVAFWGRDLLWSAGPPFLAQATIDLSLDGRVLAFTLGVSLATGVICGLLPALQASKSDLVSALKQSASSKPQTGRRWSLRDGLVVLQIALSLIALIGAGLFLRSLSRAYEVDLGFESERLLVGTVNLGTQGYDRHRGLEFYRRLVEEVRARPGVERAALSQAVPLTATFMRTIFLEGREAQGGRDGRFVQVASVDEGYLETMGIRLHQGRSFNEFDSEEAPQVAIINQTMADRFWPGEDALGKRFYFFRDTQPQEVVGVAADSKYSTVGEAPQPYIYRPLRQSYNDQMTLHVRTKGIPELHLEPTRRVVQGLDADLPLSGLATIQSLIDDSLWAPKMAAGLLSVFGVVALCLSIVGIYGVMGHVVSQRRHEIGIRLAVGANRLDVAWLIVVRGMALAAVGVAGGLIVAGALSPRISTLLWINAWDPVTYAWTALALSLVCLIANLLPARRASVMSPLLVLREGDLRG